MRSVYSQFFSTKSYSMSVRPYNVYTCFLICVGRYWKLELWKPGHGAAETLFSSFDGFWNKRFSSTIVCRVGKLPLRIGQIGNMICSLKKAGFI